MKTSIKAKTLSGTLGLALLLTAVPAVAQEEQSAEQIRAELQEQITELQEQIEELQAKLQAKENNTFLGEDENDEDNEEDENSEESEEGGGSSGLLPSQASNRARHVKACLQMNRILKRGDSGEEVKQMQEWLKDQGYFNYEQATGYYGKITEEAVKKFQKEEGIVSRGNPRSTGYGQVGPKTRSVFAKVTCLRDDPDLDQQGDEEEGEEESEDEEGEEEENEDEEDEEDEEGEEEENATSSESDTDSDNGEE